MSKLVKLSLLTLLVVPALSHAIVITGTIANWQESGPLQTIGNNTSGFFGVLRIDDIIGNGFAATLNGTWWFQTDGSGNFSSMPEPGTLSLLLVGLVSIGFARRRKA